MTAPFGHRTTTRRLIGAALALALLLAAAACGDGDGDNDRRSAGEPSAPSTTSAAPTSSTAAAGEPVIDPDDGGDYRPAVDPADFVDTVDNPYFPLAVGSRWVFEGGGERVVVHVTDRRQEVMGIDAMVVRDTVHAGGELVEDTFDWFAQDRDANVWYLGEASTTYEGGEAVSTEGSWEAGIDGALPGIVMLADPVVGEAYRQEYLPGEAEDMGEVRRTGAELATPAGDYTDVVVTGEWTPLEPAIVEEKYYAPGVGNIAGISVAGEQEHLELVSFAPGD